MATYAGDKNEPMVVQGIAYGGAADSNSNNNHKVGSPQPRKCNDAAFAILFLGHLVAIAAATIRYVPLAQDLALDAYAENNNERARRRTAENDDANNNEGENAYYEETSASEVTPQQIATLVGTVGVLAVLVSSLNLQVMVHCAKPLIKAALIFNAISMVGVAAVGFLSGNAVGGAIGSMFAVLAIWFACSVWSRIPFAASNLVTATTAIRANLGVTTFSYLSIMVGLLWNLWWFVTVSSFTAVKYYEQEQQNGGGGDDEEALAMDPMTTFLMFLFFISYYWVYQVIKNHLHVTVAGVVGTWWFAPQDASRCCSAAVGSSWCRASTSSFGSICFGSLIVAIIQAVREMLQMTRDADDTGILVCIVDCCLGCIESLVEYFNQWAYVFVGLYGYGFVDAAKSVMTLFKERGWTAIIADVLVDRVLMMLSVLMGLIMGLVSVAVAAAQGIALSDDYGGPAGPFLLGFMLGMALNSVLMNVIGSAVNTVIVCYAEAPADFEQNHPELSATMRESWAQAYPDKFQGQGQYP
jgi:hypothetical protein